MAGKNRNALPAGYQIHWYTIKDVLGQGGFGITYLAMDNNLNQPVAIKEYLPSGIAIREHDSTVHPITDDQRRDYEWGLERFISEARTLTQFDHSNIVRVLATFELNQTAYMVMRYEEGQGLDKLLPKNATLDEQWLKRMLFAIIGGLNHVHAGGFIHRDIKPPNIFIRKDGSPVLIDFGSARQSLGQETRTLTAMISPGFAPFEQYHAKSDQQGPWTDIYGLGATLYRAVTGTTPADALERGECLLGGKPDPYRSAHELAAQLYSIPFLDAIDHAMAFKEKDRPRSLGEWLDEINGKNEPKPGPAPEPSTNSFAQTAITQPLGLVPDEIIEDEVLTSNPEKKAARDEKPKKKFRLFSKRNFVLLLIVLLLAAALYVVRPWRALQRLQAPAAPAATDSLENFTGDNTAELARNHIDRLKNNPGDITAISSLETLIDYHAARARQAMQNGDRKAARQHLQQAMEAAPNERIRNRIQKRIDRLGN